MKKTNRTDEGISDFFKGISRGIGKMAAVPQGMGRAIKKGYNAGVADIGGGKQTFQQISKQVANVNQEQAKAIIDYIDKIISNPSSVSEALSDIRGIAGANKSGLIPSDEITAVSAAFQEEGERLAKRYIDVAIDSGAIDLNKEGLGQTGGQAAAPSSSLNPLQNQQFVDSLHSLSPEELQKIRDFLLPKAGMAGTKAPSQTPSQAAPAATTAATAPAAIASTAAQAAPTAPTAATATTAPAAATATTTAPAASTAPSATTAKTTANNPANRARVKKDIETINAAISGITKSIKTDLLPADKARLARELVNVMADNKKARPEAWQNAYATVKKVLQNVGSEIDFALPKGKQNVAKDLIAALNAGQTRNQLATGINAKPVKKPETKLGKSSTAGRLGKAGAQVAPRATTAPTAPTAEPERMVAEERSLDSIDLYFLNKFLAELDLSWKDIGYTLLESKSNTFTLKDSKIHELDTLLENVLNEFEQGGYSAAEYMWDVIQKQVHPMNLDSLPKQKLAIANKVLEWEKALKNQVETKGEYTGKFDAATQAAFEEIWEAVAAVAMAAYRPTSRKPYL